MNEGGKIDNIMHLSLERAIKHRLPWLVLGLVGGIAASGIVGSFEKTLSENIILAAFIPLIVYMSDAVGTQMEAFAIRDLALHKSLNFTKYFMRQLYVVSIIGFALSTGLFAYIFFVHQNIRLAIAVSISLFIAILSSVITGLVFPKTFNKYRMDPANASGPIATIIQDLLSIIIYFITASIIM